MQFKTVAELLAVPERWTRNVSARNANGVPVCPTSPDAVCWCVAGAITRVYSDIEARLAARRRLATVEPSLDMAQWNDRVKDHATMHAVLVAAGI